MINLLVRDEGESLDRKASFESKPAANESTDDSDIPSFIRNREDRRSRRSRR